MQQQSRTPPVPEQASEPPRRPVSPIAFVVGALAALGSPWIVGSGVDGIWILAAFGLAAAVLIDSPLPTPHDRDGARGAQPSPMQPAGRGRSRRIPG